MPLPRFLFLSCALVSCLGARAETTYSWSAFAGLPPQFGSRDGVGTTARFFEPFGMVGLANGELFVCDSANHTIRLVLPDGTVSTFAGLPGQSGAVDGPGAMARYSYPSGITFSGGFFYVSDTGNHAIRRVGAGGATNTFAGRPGASGSTDGAGPDARFNAPAAIDTDGNGTFYVADTNNHVIRKITAAGEVTTFAGSPGTAGFANGAAAAARFNHPSGLYVTGNGTVYVADTYNHVIRRIDEYGNVTSIAGQAGVSGATNGAGSAARFRYPRGIVAYSDGSLMVVDESHVVRQISPSGVVSTYAGRLDVQGARDGTLSEARFFVPLGLAFTPAGLAVADGLNHAIRAIDPRTGVVATLAGSTGNFGREDGVGSVARFNFPCGVAVHASGDIYLADSRGNSIRRISPNGTVTRIAGAATGDAYLDGPAGANSLNYPQGVAVAPDRTVYFCEQQRHTIRVVRPDGAVTTLAGREGVSGSANGAGDAARFNFPLGIAIDREGNLYIADWGNHAIRRIAAGTNVVTTFAGLLGAAGAADGKPGRFTSPRGVAIDPTNGSLIVADGGNHTLRRVNTDGDVSTIAGAAQTPAAADGAGAAARFRVPFAVAVDAKGTIFVADYGNDLIRKVVGDLVTTIGGSGQIGGFLDGAGMRSRFAKPSGIAVDNRGVLYVSEADNNIVRRGEPLGLPEIQTQPASIAVPPGTTAELSVTASGGALTYQWRLNGSAIPGATASTYAISNASAASAGSYTVSVTNSFGTMSSQPAEVTLSATSEMSRLTNLSLLSGLAGSEDNITMGFVIGGAGTTGLKPLVIRAAGPSLAALGVAGTATYPKLELFYGSRSIGANDNWGGAATLATAMSSVGAFAYASAGSLDAAAAQSFQSGNNSLKVSAAESGSGLVLAEIYDATPAASFTSATPRLVNVSVLKHVGSGITAGFAIGGIAPKAILIRAIGPTLAEPPFGMSGVLADPQMTVFSAATPVATSDNWGGTAALVAAFARVGAFPLPTTSRDAAILTSLPPGAYTVNVSGTTSTSGIALIEIYEVP